MSLGNSLVKIAEHQLKPKKKPSGLRTAATGALGLGLGIPVGYGLGHVLERASGGKVPSSVMRVLAPAIGLGLGVAHHKWREAERDVKKDAGGSS